MTAGAWGYAEVGQQHQEWTVPQAIGKHATTDFLRLARPRTQDA